MKAVTNAALSGKRADASFAVARSSTASTAAGSDP